MRNYFSSPNCLIHTWFLDSQDQRLHGSTWHNKKFVSHSKDDKSCLFSECDGYEM